MYQHLKFRPQLRLAGWAKPQLEEFEIHINTYVKSVACVVPRGAPAEGRYVNPTTGAPGLHACVCVVCRNGSEPFDKSPLHTYGTTASALSHLIPPIMTQINKNMHTTNLQQIVDMLKRSRALRCSCSAAHGVGPWTSSVPSRRIIIIPFCAASNFDFVHLR